MVGRSFSSPVGGSLRLPQTQILTGVESAAERRLTSFRAGLALDVHMTPLPVFFQRAPLLVAATAVVTLERLLHCWLDRWALETQHRGCSLFHTVSGSVQNNVCFGVCEITAESEVSSPEWVRCHMCNMCRAARYWKSHVHSACLEFQDSKREKPTWKSQPPWYCTQVHTVSVHFSATRDALSVCVCVCLECGWQLPEWVRRCPLRASRRRQA